MKLPVTSRCSSVEGIDERRQSTGMEFLIDSRLICANVCQLASIILIESAYKKLFSELLGDGGRSRERGAVVYAYASNVAPLSCPK